MKKITTRFLAVAMALVTVFTMSEALSVTAEAAAKSVVTVYDGKSAKKASVKKVSVSVDGNKASTKVTVYLKGNKKNTVNTVTTVNLKGTGKGKQKVKNADKVTYKTSNSQVASVNGKGVITLKKAGKATITVTSKADKKKSYKIKLTVKNGIKSMSVDKNAVTVTTGKTAEVNATVTLQNKVKGVKSTIKATSEDSSIASVKVDGKKVIITGGNPGTTTVKIAPVQGSSLAKTVTVTVEDYKYTRVDFKDPKAKKVTLKGTLTFDNTKDTDIVTDIETVLAAIGGDFDITIGAKTLKVNKGKTTQDLTKLVKEGTRTDVEVTCTKTIEEMLTMMSGKSLAKDVAYAGTLKVTGLGDITDIKISKDKATFTISKTTYTAFVSNGNLYLEGNQKAIISAWQIVKDNNSVIAGFTPVEDCK